MPISPMSAMFSQQLQGHGRQVLRRCGHHNASHLAVPCGAGGTYWRVSRREWMEMGVAGIVIHDYYGSFPHSLLSTSKSSY